MFGNCVTTLWHKVGALRWGVWGGLRGLFFQDLTYLSSGRLSYERKGAVRLPSVMVAEIMWPHNAFNYVAVASETGGGQNGSKAIWERVSRQLTSFCPPPLSTGGWPLDNTPEQQRRLGTNVYKLIKAVHVAGLHLGAICPSLMRWCCCALMSISFNVFLFNFFLQYFPFFLTILINPKDDVKQVLYKAKLSAAQYKGSSWGLF